MVGNGGKGVVCRVGRGHGGLGTGALREAGAPLALLFFPSARRLPLRAPRSLLGGQEFCLSYVWTLSAFLGGLVLQEANSQAQEG